MKNGDIDLHNPLFINKDFSMDYGWVYYIGNTRIDHNKSIYFFQPDDSDEVIQEFINENFFVKSHEWKYEKEFRIVFHFFKDAPEKIALFFDKEKLMKNGGGLSIMMAPELQKVDKDCLAKELGIPSKKVTRSKLKIKMDLITRNRSSIVDHFCEIVRGVDSDTDLDKMWKEIEKQSQRKKS